MLFVTFRRNWDMSESHAAQPLDYLSRLPISLTSYRIPLLRELWSLPSRRSPFVTLSMHQRVKKPFRLELEFSSLVFSGYSDFSRALFSMNPKLFKCGAFLSLLTLAPSLVSSATQSTVCGWSGTAPFCGGDCPLDQTKLPSPLDDRGTGQPCVTGSKNLCCQLPSCPSEFAWVRNFLPSLQSHSISV